MVSSENLHSVETIQRQNPDLTSGALRWMIFNAAENGLEKAIVRIGRRVYIDGSEFNRWLESRRASPLEQSKGGKK